MCSIRIDNLFIKRGNFKLKCEHLFINKGEKVAVLGENGSGKTTFLLAVSGNVENFEGKIELFDKAILSYKEKERAKLISFLPQFGDILFNNTVFDVVLLGRYGQNNGIFRKDDFNKTEKMLSDFDLMKFKNRGFHELSGGEKRRVFLAKTMNQEAVIDILDEPFANMDIKYSLYMLEIMQKMKKTTIASLHDINIAMVFFDRLIVFKKGEIIFDGPKSSITKEVVDEAYEVSCRILDNRFMFF